MEYIVVAGFITLLIVVLVINRQTNSRIEAISVHMAETKSLQGQTTEAFGQIQTSIGKLSEASRHMEDVGKEITGLTDILRAPKLRGGIGELLLGDLLAQILSPEHYQIQHTFKNGSRVDAVIILKAGMVPVDAKFPLESFQRILAASEEDDKKKHRKEFTKAVKTHIDAISQKYILPDEGTFDFALMYIPAENVYYETIISDEALGEKSSVLNYALENRVIPVSPNSFYAYLQAIALGLRGLNIEKTAQTIMQQLSRIEGDFGRFKQEYSTLGGHIERARNKYDEADKSLDRFGDKLFAAAHPTNYLQASDEGDE